MNRKLILTLVMVLAVATLSVPAVAGSYSVTLTLASPVQFGHSGEMVSFFATVMAPGGNSGPVYLNGDSFNVASPLSLDDTPFLLNYPLSMNPGDNFSGLLFTLTIPNGTASGAYDGYFQIVGGSDPNGQGPLSNVVDFRLDVAEPSALLLLLSSGSIALFGVVRRRRLLRQ